MSNALSTSVNASVIRHHAGVLRLSSGRRRGSSGVVVHDRVDEIVLAGLLVLGHEGQRRAGDGRTRRILDRLLDARRCVVGHVQYGIKYNLYAWVCWLV